MSVTAQKPHSTGSGIYLTSLVHAFDAAGHEQAVVGGVYADDRVDFPQGVAWYPVTFSTSDLPFPICGMSDEMPYPSTRYRDMTPEMVARFRESFLAVLRRAVEEFRPDVILVHHLYLLAAFIRDAFPDARIYGICHGTCLRQLDTNPLCKEEIVSSVARLDGFFCLHEEHARRVEALFEVPEDRIAIIGSGFDAHRFRRIDDGARRNGGMRRIAYAGKVARAKGVLSLLRAIKLLPFASEDVKVELAGGLNARDVDEVRTLADGAPYSVALLGFVSQDELVALLNRADVFVLASYYEGLPLALPEAMACGCRVVCTDLPGVRPWMDAHVPGNGIRWVAPPAMASADVPVPGSLPAFEGRLAEAIEAALDDAKFLGAPACDLSALSWDGVAEAIVRRFGLQP